jgi:RimJ/RimL family protein N-acetyltransferase
MLSGERVILAPLDRCHAERTRAWMNDPHLSWLLGRARPVSDAEHERWRESLLQRDDCVFFAVLGREDRRHLGNVWLWDIDPRHRKAELRIVLGDETSRGRGLGTEAIRLVCRYGFERLNLHRVYAHVLDINPAAQRAFTAAGFAVEGTLRADRWVGDRYADVFLFARLRESG